MTKLTDQQICIKLAEAMDICLHTGGWSEKWDKCVTCGVRREDVMNQTFDPLNDANDCEAVITHFRKLGYHIIINHYEDGVGVSMRKGVDIIGHKNTLDGDGSDWKPMICELALKVMT